MKSVPFMGYFLVGPLEVDKDVSLEKFESSIHHGQVIFERNF